MKPQSAPSHVLLVPDGHRRFARRMGISRRQGYEQGEQVGEMFIRSFVLSAAVPICSFFLLSSRTLQRDADTLADIFISLERFLKFLRNVPAPQLRVVVHGRYADLPHSTVELIHEVVAARPTGSTVLNLLIGYSGLEQTWSILQDAARRGLGASEAISLSPLGPIELVLRSEYMLRFSDAPLLELYSAKFLSLGKLFPEITEADINRALTEYRDWAASKEVSGS